MSERLRNLADAVIKAGVVTKHVVDTIRVGPGMEIGIRTGESWEDVVIGTVTSTNLTEGTVTLDINGEEQTHSSSQITFLF